MSPTSIPNWTTRRSSPCPFGRKHSSAFPHFFAYRRPLTSSTFAVGWGWRRSIKCRPGRFASGGCKEAPAAGLYKDLERLLNIQSRSRDRASSFFLFFRVHFVLELPSIRVETRYGRLPCGQAGSWTPVAPALPD